ncbi:LytR C-terminal domain-containing protein [Arthrobacter sp. Hor0625]|uniref:LytR C-terminal domain-containing protein n=1 Tax=Arthrobacter sp. Hor0625 TaxID=3457358 RepID=UPI00403EE7C9
MTKYARDEFDRVPETSTRQGVHRAVAAAGTRRLGPILAVGAVALAIGLFAFLLLPKLGFAGSGPAAVAVDQAASNATASQAPTAGATASSGPTASNSPTASPKPTATTPTASPEAGVDKTQPVAIYNGTTTPGLAGRVGSTVTADGWAAGPVANWGGAPQQTSVVYYSGPAQKANAEALAALLGIGTVVDSAEFQMPLVVVLGPGFQ